MEGGVAAFEAGRMGWGWRKWDFPGCVSISNHLNVATGGWLFKSNPYFSEVLYAALVLKGPRIGPMSQMFGVLQGSFPCL